MRAYPNMPIRTKVKKEHVVLDLAQGIVFVERPAGVVAVSGRRVTLVSGTLPKFEANVCYVNKRRGKQERQKASHLRPKLLQWAL